MLLPIHATVAVIDGEHLHLFQNGGHEGALSLTAQPNPHIETANAGSGGRHVSSSSNPDGHHQTEDARRFRDWVGPNAPEWGSAIAFPESGRIKATHPNTNPVRKRGLRTRPGGSMSPVTPIRVWDQPRRSIRSTARSNSRGVNMA